MDERLEPHDYLVELRALQATISTATSRAQALDEEEKPRELAGGLDLAGLIFLLERAEDRALEAVTAAEILAATKGLQLEDG